MAGNRESLDKKYGDRPPTDNEDEGTAPKQLYVSGYFPETVTGMRWMRTGSSDRANNWV